MIYRDQDALTVYRSDFLQISMLSREDDEVTRYVIAPYQAEPGTPFGSRKTTKPGI